MTGWVSGLRKGAAFATRVGLPLGGAILGAALGGPVGAVAGAATGGAIAEPLARITEGREQSVLGTIGAAGAAAIPAGPAARIAAKVAKPIGRIWFVVRCAMERSAGFA